VGENGRERCIQVIGNTLRYARKRFLKVFHPVKAASDFHLYIVNGFGVYRGNIRNALPEGRQSLTVSSFDSLDSFEEFRHTGHHPVTREDNITTYVGRTLTNEGDVTAHISDRGQNLIQIGRSRGSKHAGW
jgi:hypothetical protein